MPDNAGWITALRESHDRYAALATPLTAAEAESQSFDTDWSVGQVASHIGSGAEIFQLLVEAGLAGGETPGGDQFGPIWDVWNAKSAVDQVADSIRSDRAFVELVEGLSPEQRDSFSMSMFGLDLDLGGVIGMRYGEHAIHTWDIAVALDPATLVDPSAVALLVDRLGQTAGRTAKPTDPGTVLQIHTTDPERAFQLITGPEFSLAPAEAADGDADADADADAELSLPAEAFVRLVYGRLPEDHAPTELAGNEVVTQLRSVFPGF